MAENTNTTETTPATKPAYPNSKFMKQYRIYKPMPSGTGAAVYFVPVHDTRPEKRNEFCLHINFAAQTPGMSEENFAQFDWENKIIVKMGIHEIGEMIGVIKGYTDAVGNIPKSGGEAKIYHKGAGGVNKNIEFKKTDRGFWIGVSQNNQSDATQNRRIALGITTGEALALQVLLERFINLHFDWF